MLLLSTSIFLAILAFARANIWMSEDDNRRITFRDKAPHEVQYTVSVQIYTKLDDKKSSFQHLCGGAIISSTFVITAANCVNDAPSEAIFRIVAGILKLSEMTSSREEVYVAQKIIHPKYKGGINPRHDIALLRLERPLDKSKKTIALHTSNSSLTGIADLSGWGSFFKAKNKTHSTELDALLSVSAKMFSTDVCLHELFRKNLYFDVFSFSLESNLCTQADSKYDDSTVLAADRGSPLAQKETLVGIFSWRGSSHCRCTPHPTVYSKISYYINFIKKHVKDLPK